MSAERGHAVLAAAPAPARAPGGEYGPWNPGIQSEIPSELLPLSTLLRRENVFTDVRAACELRSLTGLKLEELVVFRPERLAMHELLIRMTADLSVPDGPRIEDLGINFREMTQTIFSRHIEPHMDEVVAAYEAVRRNLAPIVDEALAQSRDGSAREASRRGKRDGGLFALVRSLRRRTAVLPDTEKEWEQGERALHGWIARGHRANDPAERAALLSLTRVVASMRAKHGRPWGDTSLLASLAVGMACNEHGSDAIGELIDPHIRKGAMAEGYRLLPPQQKPVVMNTKGASASGKSTMRPLQKKLAGEIGVEWSDFAVISPDIWRKFLLDYDRLASAYKYAGMLTGQEVGIIDQKLDRYMARKAERGGMSHLLIDRFRFDSFAPDSEEAGSNLLTRFGNLIYMFFMITPPHETVERSWKRGLEVGRYKAVDDLLAHNIEAYTGMPELFFTWALREGKRVHYEFLDNSVPFGERPRTIAFGWNGEMNVLDVKGMLDIDRYRKINVNATRPEEVYPDDRTMAPENNTQFLTQCARMLAAVNFAERDTGRVYAHLEAGRLAWSDRQALAKALDDKETRAGILAVAPAILSAERDGGLQSPVWIESGRFQTLGRWGMRH